MPIPPDLPTTLTDRTAFLLQLALARAQEMGERALLDLGVAGREYGVLAVLEGGVSRPQHAIGTALGIDRTTTMTLVSRLEERGLVRRDRDRSDRRVYQVRLTRAGERLRSEAAAVLHECDDSFTAALSAADRSRLRRVLRSLADS